MLLSALSISCPLFEHLQSSVQCYFIFELIFCLTAEGFIASFHFRKEGRKEMSEVSPAAACLASLSANSFPRMSLCPAVHCNVSKYFLLFLLFSMMCPIHRISLAILCARLLMSDLKAARAAWLSTLIVNDVWPFFSDFISCNARRIPTSSTSWTVCSLFEPS